MLGGRLAERLGGRQSYPRAQPHGVRGRHPMTADWSRNRGARDGRCRLWHCCIPPLLLSAPSRIDRLHPSKTALLRNGWTRTLDEIVWCGWIPSDPTRTHIHQANVQLTLGRRLCVACVVRSIDPTRPVLTDRVPILIPTKPTHSGKQG